MNQDIIIELYFLEMIFMHYKWTHLNTANFSTEGEAWWLGRMEETFHFIGSSSVLFDFYVIHYFDLKKYN